MHSKGSIMRLSSITDYLLTSNRFLRRHFGLLAGIVTTLFVLQLLWTGISIPLMGGSAISFGIASGVNNLVKWIVITTATFFVCFKCYRSLSGNFGQVDRRERIRLAGLLYATLAIRGCLLLLIQGLVPSVFAAMGPPHIHNISQVVSIIVAIVKYIVDTMLFFFMWPILIFESVGPLRNLSRTFRYVTRNVSVTIPSIGYLFLVVLETIVRPYFRILLLRDVSEAVLVLAAIYLAVYQMVAYHDRANWGGDQSD